MKSSGRVDAVISCRDGDCSAALGMFADDEVSRDGGRWVGCHERVREDRVVPSPAWVSLCLFSAGFKI